MNKVTFPTKAEAHGDWEVNPGTLSQCLEHREKPCPVNTKLELISRCLSGHQESSSVAEALSLSLPLTWWRACLNRWSTKSQISFGTCSGTSVASSLSREPIRRMDFSWGERAHKDSGKPQSLLSQALSPW